MRTLRETNHENPSRARIEWKLPASEKTELAPLGRRGGEGKQRGKGSNKTDNYQKGKAIGRLWDGFPGNDGRQP